MFWLAEVRAELGNISLLGWDTLSNMHGAIKEKNIGALVLVINI